MITDLRTFENTNHKCDTDVLIVGAGVAGLILAQRLREKKIRVVVLESGDREQISDTHPLNRTIQLGAPYSGAVRGRFRCLGGTSTRWGGALIPFMDHDLAARPYLNLAGFPVAGDAVRPYLNDVEKLFGVDEGSYDEEFVRQISAEKYIPIGDPDFQTRFAKWPPFSKRNLAVLLRSRIERDAGLQIWLNSTLTHFYVERTSGRISSATGRAEGGRSITVTAKYAVICAGAIEATRLLLLLDSQYNGELFRDCNALGRYFNDHISIPTATIRVKQAMKLNRLAGFRFFESTMRSLRFELSAAAQERECIGSAFGHISFKTEKSTGFDVLRDFLRSRQRGGRVRTSMLMDALRDIPYLSRMGFWRVFHNQLLWPVPATYEVHVVAEQLPRADNRITLSSENDCYGLPVPAIRWNVSQEDLKVFTSFRRCFDAFWNRQGMAAIGELDWHEGVDGSQKFVGTDVFHPGGSTRMGTDHNNAVVDANLRVFGVPNLWVASTSVFPSGGGENPTLMLMLFTMRLADHLSTKLIAK